MPSVLSLMFVCVCDICKKNKDSQEILIMWTMTMCESSDSYEEFCVGMISKYLTAGIVSNNQNRQWHGHRQLLCLYWDLLADYQSCFYAVSAELLHGNDN